MCAAVGETTQLHARDGALALQRGKSDEAIRHYSLALEDRTLPDDRKATILNDRGVAYVRLGKTREAIEDFNRAVELFPEYAATYNNRGNLLLALGLPNEAMKDFDRALALAPGYAAAYNNRAGALMQAGDPKKAIRDYTQAIRLLPAAAAPLAGRGRAHLELGRPHAAIRDFSRAVGSDSRFSAGYRSRAVAKLEVGKYDEAIEDLSRAIAFDISNTEAYMLRGDAYLGSRNLEAAIADFTRVIELTPQNAEGFEKRGLAHALAAVFEAAQTDLSRALELNPRSVTAFAYRAYAYARSGQLEIAKSDLRTAQRLEPKRAEVLWARAALEEADGQTEAAMVTYREALAAKPGFKLAIDALKRFGVEEVSEGDKLVEGLGTAGWDVVVNDGHYYAVRSDQPGIRVPLEMLGKGEPRLLSWQEKDRPFWQIGVLTYHSGVAEGANGDEETEQAAIIDLRSSAVVGIEPQRQGKKVAHWTWSETGSVTVASVDGVTDQFHLRQGYAPSPRGIASSKTRRSRRRAGGLPSWVPWADNGYGFKTYKSRRTTKRKRRRKPKSFFQFLFN